MAADDLREIGVWDSPERDPRGRFITVVRGRRPRHHPDHRRRRRPHRPLVALADLPDQLAFDHADILSAATAS